MFCVPGAIFGTVHSRVAYVSVVRHIHQAAGAEGMNKAHRDIKSLPIKIYWILELCKHYLSCALAATLTEYIPGSHGVAVHAMRGEALSSPKKRTC